MGHLDRQPQLVAAPAVVVALVARGLQVEAPVNVLHPVVRPDVGAAGDFRIRVLLRVVHVRPGPALVVVGLVGVLVALVRVLGILFPGMRVRVGELGVRVHAGPSRAVHPVAGLRARPVVGQLRAVARRRCRCRRRRQAGARRRRPRRRPRRCRPPSPRRRTPASRCRRRSRTPPGAVRPRRAPAPGRPRPPPAGRRSPRSGSPRPPRRWSRCPGPDPRSPRPRGSAADPPASPPPSPGRSCRRPRRARATRRCAQPRWRAPSPCTATRSPRPARCRGCPSSPRSPRSSGSGTGGACSPNPTPAGSTREPPPGRRAWP